MPFLEVVSNQIFQDNEDNHVLALKLDANTDVVLSDRPVFGIAVTIKADLIQYVDTVIKPNFTIGWINYEALSKLGCTCDKQYFDAQDYITNISNQLCFTRTVRLVAAYSKIGSNKEILKFVVV